ncbi:hypothetical protein [[Curtobacterium] plantarum]|uniref:hypothetical protein n=1 Tax=[Curtobacterium] plantarum TaxID=221276 RepID=UPI000F094E81|nr:hypothetical protein [[Curtobacterium] plantarum]RNA73500.1 hypothetical protein EBO33_21670 [[Curtobacterium] plantarum]
MLHSEARAKSERSIHTIMDNTSVIDTIKPRSLSPDTVEVRRMLSRTHNDSQHFIVTLVSDILRAKDTEVVKPLAELAIRNNKVRFTVKPKKQYPDLRVNEDILHSIEDSIASFMHEYFNMDVAVSDNIRNDKRPRMA